METKIALIIVAFVLLFYIILKIREAGEKVTRLHEMAAYEEQVKRAHAHSEEQARKKARQEMAPHLMRPLKDYRNPTPHGEPDILEVGPGLYGTGIDGMYWDAKERKWVVKS